MKKRNKLRIIIYSLAVTLPVLSLLNCSGWNTATGEVKQCIIDYSYLRDISNTIYSAVFFSAFLLGIPIMLYAVAVFSVVELPILLYDKLRNHRNKYKRI